MTLFSCRTVRVDLEDTASPISSMSQTTHRDLEGVNEPGMYYPI